MSTLLAVLLLSNTIVLLYTVSPIDEISGPVLFAHWKALYVLLATILLVIPLFSWFIALLVALLPIRGFGYGQRVFTAFLVVCVIVESIGLYKSVVDYFSVLR